MFDSSPFEMPSTPVQEEMPKPEVADKIADFLEEKLKDPDSKWAPLMADAWENGAWGILQDELMQEGMHVTPKQLEADMKLVGDKVFAKAIKMAVEGSDEENVDVSDLDKAA